MPLQLPLTERQRDHLRELRRSQLQDWRAGWPKIVDRLFVEEDVVRLMSYMGQAAYLGLDGRIWIGNLAEGELPRAIHDARELASCVVRWAGAIDLPELVDALPKMPAHGEVCCLCKGTRYMPDEVWQRPEDGSRYVCQRCSGLGWTSSPGAVDHGEAS